MEDGKSGMYCSVLTALYCTSTIHLENLILERLGALRCRALSFCRHTILAKRSLCGGRLILCYACASVCQVRITDASLVERAPRAKLPHLDLQRSYLVEETILARAAHTLQCTCQIIHARLELRCACKRLVPLLVHAELILSELRLLAKERINLLLLETIHIKLQRAQHSKS